MKRIGGKVRVALVLVAVCGFAIYHVIRPQQPVPGRSSNVVEAVEGEVILLDVKGTICRIRLTGVVAVDGAEAVIRRFADEGPIRLLSEPVPQREESGDLLAYVYHEQGGLTLNERLVAEGVAFAERRHDYAYAPTLIGLESEARRQRVGMWSAMPQDPPMPRWRRVWLDAQRATRR